MTALGTVRRKVTRSFLQFTVCLAFSAFILFAAEPCRGSGSSQMFGTLVVSDSSNMFFIAINTSFDLSGRPNMLEAPAGIVISNGMYSIDINMDADATEELLPSGVSSGLLDINQALNIYAELTGRELGVDEDVRQVRGVIQFPPYPEMARRQACELLEATLLKQAGVEISKLDSNHAIVRLRNKLPP